MKQLRILAVISFIVLFAACKSKEKKTDQTSSDTTMVNSGDTTTVGPPPPQAPMGPSSVLVARHKIANYDKWLSSFEGNDSLKTANGLHNYLVARGVEDSNMVLVALTMDDPVKAKAFSGSKELKDAMKKGGVIGAPMMDFLKADMNDTTAISDQIRLMVKHKVKDFDAWKKVFDSDHSNRMSAGLTDRVVAHTVDDNNNVTVVFAVSDLAKAKMMGTSPELKAKMDSAGVVGKPDFFYYKVAKKYQ